MKIIYLFLIFWIVVSCKEKNTTQALNKPQIEITQQGKIIPIDSIQLNRLNDSLLTAFYSANNYKTFWLADSYRNKIIELFNNAKFEGLFTKDFDINEIQTTEKNLKYLSDSALISYDFLITRNLIRYIKKTSKGTLNPNKIYKNCDLKETNINYKELLLNFQKKDSFNIALKKIYPTSETYKQLKNALEIIYKLPEENYKKIEVSNKLVLNDTNNILIDIKKKLLYWKDLKQQDSLTPVFDKITELAIKKFQLRHGLAPDGEIGIQTVKALNFSKEQRKEQIIANMERWRWYSRMFENNYLIINIPNYTLTVVKNGDTVRTHKIIVGRATRKTPLLSSKLSSLIFNPTWTVPPTILKNDILPSAKKNSNYFTEKNIKIYNSNNQLVKVTDWDYSNAKNYHYVQSPGLNNSLGLVKFIFKNKFTIYLHDTNSKSFFEKNIRALSSGCIRVQNPFQLTEYILDDPENWNLEKIENTIKDGKTKEVTIKKDVYIYVLYWTAWSENGELQFRDDLYNLDKDLYQKLKS